MSTEHKPSRPRTLLEEVEGELLRRLRTASVEELAILYAQLGGTAASLEAARAAWRPSYSPTPPPVGVRAPSTRLPITLAAAIENACEASERPLAIEEIIADVMRAVPGAREASIRSEVSKMARTKRLWRHGPALGGTYEPWARGAGRRAER